MKLVKLNEPGKRGIKKYGKVIYRETNNDAFIVNCTIFLRESLTVVFTFQIFKSLVFIVEGIRQTTINSSSILETKVLGLMFPGN